MWERMLYRLRRHYGRCDLSRLWQCGACSCGRLNARGRVGDSAWGCGRLNLRLDGGNCGYVGYRAAARTHGRVSCSSGFAKWLLPEAERG